MTPRVARKQPRQTSAAPRTLVPASIPAPTRGWIANSNLAMAEPGGAAVLDNWFPTATSALLRRGAEIYATLGLGDLDVTAIFDYKSGNNEKLFGATEEAIYDITSIVSAENYLLVDEDGDVFVDDLGNTFGETSTVGLEVAEDQDGGAWIFVQFATSGGTFLVGVNGENDQLLFDGTTWYPISTEPLNALDYDGGTDDFTVGGTLTGGTSGATSVIVKIIGDTTSGTLWLGTVTGGPYDDNEAITDGGGGAALADGINSTLWSAMTGVDPATLSYVWVYKNRLFYVQKDSLDAWYLAVDSVTGTATKFPLGGVFTRGGRLLFGAAWSLDSGDGLSEQCVFVTTEGEVAVYRGSDPGDANDWLKVGTYRVGRPLGPKAHIKAGGDLVIATDIGFVPLSQAVQRDYAALSPSAVSFPIEVAWNESVQSRKGADWHCDVWAANQMVVVAPPTINDEPEEMYVANSRTGAWARYTGWSGTCLNVFKDRFFYGSQDGKIIEGNIGGLDQEATYTGVYVPLFSDLGTPAVKTASMARAVLKSGVAISEQITMQRDFDLDLGPAPESVVIASASEWGTGVWGTMVWGETREKQLFQYWRAASAKGYALAPALQITSGSVAPLDVELIRIDMTYTTGGVVT